MLWDRTNHTLALKSEPWRGSPRGEDQEGPGRLHWASRQQQESPHPGNLDGCGKTKYQFEKSQASKKATPLDKATSWQEMFLFFVFGFSLKQIFSFWNSKFQISNCYRSILWTKLNMVLQEVGCLRDLQAHDPQRYSRHSQLPRLGRCHVKSLLYISFANFY